MTEQQEVSYQDRLAALDDSWVERSNTPTAFEVQPVGTFITRVQVMELRMSAKQKMQTYIEFFIFNTQFAGQTLRMWISLETDDGPRRLALFFKKMGLSDLYPESASDLESVFAKITTAHPGAKVQSQAPREEGRFPRIQVLGPVAEEDMPSEPEGVETASEVLGDDVVEEAPVPVKKTTESPKVIKPPVATKKAAKKEEATVTIEDLQAFCLSHEVEYAEEDDMDALIAKINEWEYPSDQLTAGETAMLQTIGGAVKTADPAPAPTPTPAPKPAAKAKQAPEPEPTPKKKKGVTPDGHLTTLKGLCSRLKLPTDDVEDTVAGYVAFLDEYELKAKILKPEEIAVLKKVGVEVVGK